MKAFSLRGQAALACLCLTSSCGGSDTADALIGPEGGMVAHDDGITLVVPPGALLTTRQIVIRPSSDDEVEAIMATQASRGQRQAAADDLVFNDGEMAALAAQVDGLHEKYLDLARSKLHAAR